jgi:hypothetical protein
MKLDKDITVIDDFIDKKYQEKIKNILMGNDPFLWKNEEVNFDWYFISDVTDAYSSRQQKRSALVHTFFEEGETINDDVLNYFFLPMLKNVRERMKIKNMNVVQGRSFLQFPLSLKDKTPDTPHIDLDQGIEHIVALYYVCDSDGDTIIYNEREDQGLESKSYTIKEKVTPKQGRMVIFDGTLYHTAEQPKDNIRCVVNYDLEII